MQFPVSILIIHHIGNENKVKTDNQLYSILKYDLTKTCIKNAGIDLNREMRLRSNKITKSSTKIESN